MCPPSSTTWVVTAFALRLTRTRITVQIACLSLHNQLVIQILRASLQWTPHLVLARPEQYQACAEWCGRVWLVRGGVVPQAQAGRLRSSLPGTLGCRWGGATPAPAGVAPTMMHACGDTTPRRRWRPVDARDAAETQAAGRTITICEELRTTPCEHRVCTCGPRTPRRQSS